jgi:chromosome segregation ATPase
MNAFGYIVRRLARSFGLRNERERMVVARREAQLLSEAENILGQMAWEHTENIEELSDEYWQIKEISSKQITLSEEIRLHEVENRRLQVEHDKLEAQIEAQIEILNQRKADKMKEAMQLMHQAEEKRHKAELTKKKFSGAKTKYKFLSQQGEEENQLEEVLKSLHNLKEIYAGQKAEIQANSAEIQQKEKEAADIVEEINLCRNDARERLTAMITEVGKSSNLVAKRSAEIGALNRTKKQLIYDVGTFLSINSGSKNPEIRKVINHTKGLIAKIDTLRRSIAFNNLLSGREG